MLRIDVESLHKSLSLKRLTSNLRRCFSTCVVFCDGSCAGERECLIQHSLETTTDRCEFRKKAKESLNIFSFIHSVVFLLYPEFVFRSIFTVKIKEMTKYFVVTEIRSTVQLSDILRSDINAF